jgi:hypothetical protein
MNTITSKDGTRGRGIAMSLDVEPQVAFEGGKICL